MARGTTARKRQQDKRQSTVVDVKGQLKLTHSRLDAMALWVTGHVGTMGFFLLILVWTVGWLGWNVFGPGLYRFDPYPAFVMWLFISNMIQILLMPLILIGQNLQSRHAALRAEADFVVNKRAEAEIDAMQAQLDRIEARLKRPGRSSI